MTMQRRMIRQPLPRHAQGQGFGVEVNEMNFTMARKKSREVKVVAVAGAENAKPRLSRGRARREKSGNPGAMIGEDVPAVADRLVVIQVQLGKRVPHAVGSSTNVG